MTVAALIPTAGEYEAFVSAMESLGHRAEPVSVGRISCLSYLDGRLLTARGRTGQGGFRG